MPKSKKAKHGSGKPHKPKPLTYDPVYTDGLTENLRNALKAKLTLKELIDLELQLRKAVEQTARRATFDCHKTTWAVTLRVLHDRFGFEAEDKRRLYDSCLEYLKDIRDKRITLQEMLDTLYNEDHISLSWDDEDDL
jgi:hypothetical protein